MLPPTQDNMLFKKKRKDSIHNEYAEKIQHLQIQKTDTAETDIR